MKSLKKYVINVAFGTVLIFGLLWNNAAVAIKTYKQSKSGKSKVKNVIVLISDGCGYRQMDAAGLYQYGKTGSQVYESFPVRLGMSTYSAG